MAKITNEISRLRYACSTCGRIAWTPKTEQALSVLNRTPKITPQLRQSELRPVIRERLIDGGFLSAEYRQWTDSCTSYWNPGEPLALVLKKGDITKLRAAAAERGLTVQGLLEVAVGAA